MANNRSSSFNQPPSSIMVVNAGVWENEETTVKRPDLFTVTQRTKPLLLFPEHHDRESHTDSHVVPDEDDIYEPHHSHDNCSQVAPRVARKTFLFDLEKLPAPDHDLDDAATVVVYNMINSKSSGAVAEAADYKDMVVPRHHDDCELLDSKHPDSKADVEAIASDKHTNEAEAEAALVPSLSVCSNDPHPASTRHPHQYHVRSVREAHYEQALTKKLGRTPAKRKHAKARTMEKQRVKINRKMRTLQGLIPNCNDKVDKASILDEAIVYVKALQLQLQMMLMPPMHLSYLPTTPAAAPAFPMLGFPSFVPLPPPLLVSHPSISLSNSINTNLSNHLLQHHQQ